MPYHSVVRLISEYQLSKIKAFQHIVQQGETIEWVF